MSWLKKMVTSPKSGVPVFCRSPVLWAIVGLPYYVGILSPWGQGSYWALTVLSPVLEKLRKNQGETISTDTWCCSQIFFSFSGRGASVTSVFT